MHGDEDGSRRPQVGLAAGDDVAADDGLRFFGHLPNLTGGSGERRRGGKADDNKCDRDFHVRVLLNRRNAGPLQHRRETHRERMISEALLRSLALLNPGGLGRPHQITTVREGPVGNGDLSLTIDPVSGCRQTIIQRSRACQARLNKGA